MRVVSIFKDGNCRDSACPAFLEFDDPDWVGVVGKMPGGSEDLTGVEVSGDERLVLIPRALAEQWKASGR